MRRLIAALLLASACSSTRHRDAAPSADRDVRPQSAPRLDAIRPDSVFVASGAVVEVILEGRGFAPGTPGRNTILFDALTLNDVPADSSGTRIRFVLPEMIPSGGEAPPQPLAEGRHVVRIRTANGESNPATVRVFR